MVEIDKEETKTFAKLEIFTSPNAIPNNFPPGKTHAFILMRLK